MNRNILQIIAAENQSPNQSQDLSQSVTANPLNEGKDPKALSKAYTVNLSSILPQ